MKTDYERLMQCILCENDPERCGCTDADENEQGMCTKYKGRKGETRMDFAQERDSAIIDFVLNDDLTKYKEYCKKYKVPMPSNERIMKAAIYKASQHCLFISANVKELARKKCIELGFRPEM